MTHDVQLTPLELKLREKYTEVENFDGEFGTNFYVGNQQFRIHLGTDAEEAEWARSMLAKALAKMLQDEVTDSGLTIDASLLTVRGED